MPKSRNGRRFLAVIVVAVILVGGGLLVAKSISNKSNTEVAVTEPAKEKSAKPDKEPTSEDKSAATAPAEGATSQNMPSELTQTGATQNLAIIGLLAGVAVYFALLNIGTWSKLR